MHKQRLRVAIMTVLLDQTVWLGVMLILVMLLLLGMILTA
jgi:hypothetical protein